MSDTSFKMGVDTLYIKVKGNQFHNSSNNKQSKLFLRHFYSLVNKVKENSRQSSAGVSD